MEVKKEIIVNQSADQVWEVLGNQYGEAYQWARGLYQSKGEGIPTIKGAPFSNRACATSFGALREEVRVFQPGKQLSYEVIEGFPGFIKRGVNNWYLQSVGENQTKVTMHFVGETQGVMGVVMGPMMKLNLSKGLEGALADFKHFVETGAPSPEKIKDNQKNQKRLDAAA